MAENDAFSPQNKTELLADHKKDNQRQSKKPPKVLAFWTFCAKIFLDCSMQIFFFISNLFGFYHTIYIPFTIQQEKFRQTYRV